MLRSVIKFGRCYKNLCIFCCNTRKSVVNCVSKNFQISAAIASNHGTCSYLKKICDNRWSDGNQRKQKARQDKWSYQIKHDWLDALGWSGVFLLGWYLCQPYCHRITKNPAERYAYQQLANCSRTDYSSIIKCLTKVLNLDSTARYVIPTVNASKTSGLQESQRHDEVLKEVCDQLEEANIKVNSSLQNFLGTECMQLGKHDEAFSHFSEAAKSCNSAAYFNLGICHEMGLGTKQCFAKAAEYYRKAADLGHATAMYNLGVFSAHGWGGIQSDEKEAERLFIAAANSGQKDAKRALNLVTDNEPNGFISEPLPSCDTTKPCSITNSIELQNNTLTDIWFKVMNIKLEMSNGESVIGSSSNDSGINDLSPSSDLYFFQK